MVDVPVDIPSESIFEHAMESSIFWIAILTATGKYGDDIRQHEKALLVEKTIYDIIHQIDGNSISARFLLRLHNKETEAKQLLFCRQDIDRKVEHELDTCQRNLAAYQENMKIVEDTFTSIKYTPVAYMVKETLDYINKWKNNIHNGKMSVDAFSKKSSAFKNIRDLADCCRRIQNAVPTRVFWNVNADFIKNRLIVQDESDNFQEDHVLDESSLPQLFNEDFQGTKTPLRVLIKTAELLAKDCLVTYKGVWRKFEKTDDQSVLEMRKIFQGVDNMEWEMDQAEEVCFFRLKVDCRNCLKQFSNIKTYTRTVDTIKIAAEAFKFDYKQDSLYRDTVHEFEKILNVHLEGVTFKDIKPLLQNIDDVHSVIGVDLQNVLHAVQTSTELLNFLREVLDDDIRNLIDAVEEHSEQYVRESTVSDLIEIKQFFKPVLKGNFTKNVGGLFDLLQKQINQTGASKIPDKIYVCREHLHSLRALYRNVANRGERTVEVIENIMQKGIFHFSLNQKRCEIVVEYKVRKRYTHTDTDLSDLRSRALLIMNKQDKETNKPKRVRRANLEQFVETVDYAFEISDLCMQLKQAGHFDFSRYSKVCSHKELPNLKNDLQKEYNQWYKQIESCRQQFYYLNYLYADQLYELYNFLQKDKKNELNVISVLKFINPSIDNLQHITEIYKSLPTDDTHLTALQNIGKTLDKLWVNSNPKYVPNSESHVIVKMTDKVQPGIPYITALSKESPLVIRTLLALYINTTGTLPEAHQILFCRNDTNYEEISLLLNRCLWKKDHTSSSPKLYTVANIEMLSGEVQFQLHDAIRRIPLGGSFLLCFICRGHEHHSFLDQFADRLFRPTPLSDLQMKSLFLEHWSHIKVVTSEVPGLGKSEYIQRKAMCDRKRPKTIHVSGLISKLSIIEELNKLRLQKYNVLHIDIATVADPLLLDLILFELIILRYLSTGSTAYAMTCDDVYIEIANTVKHVLCSSLPTVMCFTREHLHWNSYEDLRVSSEINSPVQVVCYYLNFLDEGVLDMTDLYFNGPDCLKPLTRIECGMILNRHFHTIKDMSFTLMNNLLGVLADQLKKLSASVFFRCKNLSLMLGEGTIPSVKSNLVRALLNVSLDFSSRSIRTCRSTQVASCVGNTQEDIASILARRVSGMIRWEDNNHLVILFHQNMQTISALYRNVNEVSKSIIDLFESQVKTKLTEFKNKKSEELITLLAMLTRYKSADDYLFSKLMNSYALTADNLLKMILISLRVSAKVPVVIMGETGCGKTSLVRFLSRMCGITFDVYNIHAGITETEILQKLDRANKQALARVSTQFWLFLDEINTCDHLGVIANALCHRELHGKPVAPNLILLAACNPYRIRKSEIISTTGLQGKQRTDELSRLVYRVHPLPENLIDFVWDFGSLSDNDEESYIRKMVDKLFNERWVTSLFTRVLVMSQRFVRKVETNDYCVSLRDIDRCRRLTNWFDNFIGKRKMAISPQKRHLKAIILGLSVCYHSRFSVGYVREQYLQEVVKCFLHASYKISEAEIRDVILSEQKYILSNMTDFPTGTAFNAALQENVFMLLVCILNKIPIFLVGKPGCSKSLSMQLIRSNLRGKDSTNPLFQEMPQLFCVAFQGSESSTSEGIIKVFEKAEKYQNHNDEKDILSVVILDEIGLAEISKFNPLKVLHGLIEPDGQNLKIAVVGISNWALDAAKMNRAIHLSRPDMNLEELIYTGHSISGSMLKREEDNVFDSTNTFYNTGAVRFDPEESGYAKLIVGIARAYNEYCTSTQKFANFHGLRDFYSLIKCVRLKAETMHDVNDEEFSESLLRGILRNFGGLPTEKEHILDIFRKHIPQVSPRQIPISQLIKENILDKSSRHLMLITNGDAVLSVLESQLGDIGMPFDIIFGSSFDDDLSDDYNYRILSRIILCMEQGMVLILKDLESIYGSLYDMLNQNYTIVGKKKNCRIALGQYSNPMCYVHDDFKCIVLVEESKLDYSDPPFLNRFEKQHFAFEDLLDDKRFKDIVNEINEEVELMCQVRSHCFLPCDVIPTFCQHLLLSLIIHSARKFDSSVSNDFIKRYAFEMLIWLFPPEVMIRSAESELCKSRKANDVRLLINKFMTLPIHRGVWSYIDHIGKKFSHTCRLQISNTDEDEKAFSDTTIKKEESLEDVLTVNNLLIDDSVEPSCTTLEESYTSNTTNMQNDLESNYLTRHHVESLNLKGETGKFENVANTLSATSMVFTENSNTNADNKILQTSSDSKCKTSHEKLDSSEHEKELTNMASCIQMSKGTEKDKLSIKSDCGTEHNLEIDDDKTGSTFIKNQESTEQTRSALLCEHLSFVYTYAGINSVIEKKLSGRTVQKEKLAVFKSEKQFSMMVEEFLQSDIHILLIQCSASSDRQHLLLAKVIIEKCIRKSKSVPPNFDKCICIIVHLERQSNVEIPFNFLSGWKLVFLDSIEEPRTHLKHFLDVDQLQIVKDRMPLNNYIKDSLFWVFSRMKFTAKQNSVEHLEILLAHIKSCNYAIGTLEKCIISWIEKNSVDFSMLDMNDMVIGNFFYSTWCVNIAKNPHELLKSGTFVGAIENNIQEIIKVPLAKHIYQLIRFNLLSPVFVEDAFTATRRQVWTKILLSEQYMHIKEIPAPSGPECYFCDIDFMNLFMPYSQIVIRNLEARKDEYLEIIRRLRIANEIDPGDEIPLELFHSATDDCMDMLCYDTVEIAEDLDYSGRNEDFIRDFCNFNSLALLEEIVEEDRISMFKGVLSNFIDVDKLALGNFMRLVASLHSALWVYEPIVIAICKMIKFTLPYTDIFYPSSSERIMPETVKDSICNENQGLVRNSSIDTTKEDKMSTLIQLNDEDHQSTLIVQQEGDNFSMSKAGEEEQTNVSKCKENQCRTELDSRCDLPYTFEPIITNENIQNGNSYVAPAKYHLQDDISREDLPSNTQISTNHSFHAMTKELDTHQKSYSILTLSRDHLVKTVCLALLPTQQILSKQPLNEWLSKMAQILPLAYVVHDESHELLGLKFCQELLETFVSNNITQNNAVAKFGNCVKNADGILDSIEVCETLFTILKDLEINNLVNKEVLQRLFCSYISRCVISNPENSEPLEFALEQICKAEMFDECLSCFGQVIRFAVIIDLGENPDGFQNILTVGQHQLEDDYPFFARCFNTCLIELNSTCQNDHPFANLLLHIIEECAFEGCLTVAQLEVADTSSNPIFSNLSASLYIVKQGVFALKTVIAVAFIRKFIKVAIDLLESLKYNCGKVSLICQHINSLMFTPEVLHLFLKCIDQRSGQQYIEKIFRMIEPFVPVLKGTSWNLHFVELSPVFNPLFLHIDKDSFDLYHFQVMTVGQKNNTLHNLLLADRSEIRTLTVLAQTFYMNKCLKEKNDSELQLSTDIAGVVAQTHMNKEIKHIIDLLLGRKDFKHRIFKLSVMVESPQTQIVSVMIHLIGLTSTVSCCENIWYQTLMAPSLLKKTLWPILKLEQLCHSVSSFSFECSPISIQCMQILLYSWLVSSIGLGTASVNQISSLVGWDEVNLHEELESQLTIYWNNLKKILQLNYNDVCILIHNILLKLTPLLHIQYNDCMDIDFIKQHVEIIENCLANRIAIIHKTKHYFSSLFLNDSFSMEKCVTEVQPCYSGDKNIIETLLVMVSGLPSKDMLFADLYLCNKSEFPILKLILDKTETLSLPQRILSFLRWHLSLVTYASYKFHKVDFKDLTVAKLLTLEHDEKRKQILNNAFEAFRKDWNIIRSDYMSYLCLEGLELMHPTLKMESSAIFGEEPIILQVFKALINIQNSFLQAVCSISNTDVSWKIAGVTFREVSLLDVKHHDLLDFKWKDKWLNFSQCDTRYGLGRKIYFDFEKIEQEIKREVLFGKCMIQIPVLPKIIFLDDLFQNSVELLKEIESIVPQNHIHIDIKKDIEKKSERDASKIISHLTCIGMVLSFIRKAGAQAEHSILEYMDKWETITGISAVEQKFMFGNDIKLGHIVALYNLLEELNGKNIVHSLQDKYRKPLSQELKDKLHSSKFQHVRHYEKLDHAIKVFIHRCLSSTDNVINVKQPLIDYLSDVDFWWKNDLKRGLIVDGQTSVALKDVLSPLILVENICDTVQCLLNVVEDTKQKDVRISGITATYQHVRPKEQPTRTRIKAAKKLMGI